MMITDDFLVANLKCSGCAKTIQNKLSEIPGVLTVKVDPEQASVKVEHEESTLRSSISEHLKTLGYPEIGDDNNLLTQMKSYASCMIGKLSD
jgi:copper chaperone CopZ